MPPEGTKPILPPTDSTAGNERPGRSPWRFSLRTLILAMTLLAVWCWFVSVLPTSFSQILVGLAWIIGTGWLVTGIFFAYGDQRAFCIGAAVVVSSMWTRVGGRFIQGVFDLASQILGGMRFSQAVTLCSWFIQILTAST